MGVVLDLGYGPGQAVLTGGISISLNHKTDDNMSVCTAVMLVMPKDLD